MITTMDFTKMYSEKTLFVFQAVVCRYNVYEPIYLFFCFQSHNFYRPKKAFANGKHTLSLSESVFSDSNHQFKNFMCHLEMDFQ